MKESRKQFIREAHEAACSEWKKKIEQEFHNLFEKSKFEIGKWYKKNNFIVNYQGGGQGYGGGSMWFDLGDEYWTFEITPNLWQPATDEEVEEMLIRGANKRGLVEGARYYSIVTNDQYQLNVVSRNYEYDSDLNALSDGFGGILFYEGKWAEPINTITKAEAEKKLGLTIVD